MQPRQSRIERLKAEPFDVLILGGGINGAGVARDLALRARHAGASLRVGLVEQRHFASGTSGKNSQLIHGGLRYLKYLQFGLVRESLRERATLLETAPHLVEPLPFLIPMYGAVSRVIYTAGLALYDLLAGSGKVGRHRRLSRDETARAEPELSSEGLKGGALFYDCRVHSARLVIENVLDAASNGAVAVNYLRAGAPVREGGWWGIPLQDALSGETFTARARTVVNAKGPWGGAESLRLVRGSHIVLPRVSSGDRAIAYFDEQGRIVFLIPWGSANQLTLVGTTDVDHESGPDDVRVSSQEVGYLRGIAGRLFPGAASLAPISAYSSLRPLLRGESSSPTAASREHRVWASEDGLVEMAGGKYTTYRLMSEEATDLVVKSAAPELAGLHLTAHARFPQPAGPRIEDLPVEAQVERAVDGEMAERLADVLFVSTYLGYEQRWDAKSLEPHAAAMARRLGWDARRMDEEIALVLRIAALP